MTLRSILLKPRLSLDSGLTDDMDLSFATYTLNSIVIYVLDVVG